MFQVKVSWVLTARDNTLLQTLKHVEEKRQQLHNMIIYRTFDWKMLVRGRLENKISLREKVFIYIHIL